MATSPQAIQSSEQTSTPISEQIERPVSPAPPSASPASTDPLMAQVTKNLAASPVNPASKLDILHQSIDVHPPPSTDYPHFDAAFLESLERNAHSCAENVTHLLTTLRASLNTITSLSTCQLEAYRLGVDGLKNSVHLSVLASHELVQKSQQLHESMKGVESVAAQVREMKKMLDTVEALQFQLEKQRRRNTGAV